MPPILHFIPICFSFFCFSDKSRRRAILFSYIRRCHIIYDDMERRGRFLASIEDILLYRARAFCPYIIYKDIFQEILYIIMRCFFHKDTLLSSRRLATYIFFMSIIICRYISRHIFEEDDIIRDESAIGARVTHLHMLFTPYYAILYTRWYMRRASFLRVIFFCFLSAFRAAFFDATLFTYFHICHTY